MLNDLTSLNISGKFTMFADDTTIMWHHRDVHLLENTVSSDLFKIKEWCDANCLTLNVTKTNIMSFKCRIREVYLDSTPMTCVQCNRFLGLFIDERLKFDEHIFDLRNRLSRGCFALRVVTKELDGASARNVYFALIESHLRYGICFWGSCSNELFNSVFILQKRALRVLCRGDSIDSSRPLFIAQRILTLPCIFILETVCLMHKKFNMEISDLTKNSTRRTHLISLPIPKSSLAKNSLIYNSKKLFNHLPQEVRQIKNIKQFRKRVKSLLLARAFYTVSEFYESTC